MATAAFWLILDGLAIVFVIRRLKLAWWWGFFPPLWEGLLSGNPEPLVLACLVVGSDWAACLAPLGKVYAIAPLAGERRWKALALAVTIMACTAVVLPWARFTADLTEVSATLTAQAANLSAFSVPWLLPIGVVGLAGVGRRRAGWLAVPVLWPHTQLHYAATALPEMTTILAIGFSVPIPGAPAVAVAAQALLERLRATKTLSALGRINRGEPQDEYASTDHLSR